jgi:hypothetical protein
MPSSWYCLTNDTIACTNDVRLLALATAEEKYLDPVQPPIDRETLTD